MKCFRCRSEVNWDATHHCLRCGFPGFFLRAGTKLKNGEYELEHPLGKGGFGATYRAHHKNLRSPVAIKEFFPKDQALREPAGNVVPMEGDEEFYNRWLTRFIGEGMVLAQINHHNVVRARDVFRENGTAYLVMDFISGYSLKKEIDEAPRRCLSETYVYSIVRQLVAALHAVHAEKVYHLDLKPHNVMVTEGKRIILVDFGAARQASSRLEKSLTEGQQYTEAYAAPELILGEDIGPESDLFEMGMMIYEMLCGTLLPNALTRLGKKQELGLAGLEEPWRALLKKALEMERKQRPASISLWWEDERRYREGKEQTQREQANQARREEQGQWEQENRRLRNRCEKLSGIVRDLEVRENQALSQVQVLDQQVGFHIAEWEEQAEKLRRLEPYEPLINMIEAIRELGRWGWDLYLDLMESLLELAGRRAWISTPPEPEKRYHAHRLGLVIGAMCLFLLLFFLLRRW